MIDIHRNSPREGGRGREVARSLPVAPPRARTGADGLRPAGQSAWVPARPDAAARWVAVPAGLGRAAAAILPPPPPAPCPPSLSAGLRDSGEGAGGRHTGPTPLQRSPGTRAGGRRGDAAGARGGRGHGAAAAAAAVATAGGAASGRAGGQGRPAPRTELHSSAKAPSSSARRLLRAQTRQHFFFLNLQSIL